MNSNIDSYLFFFIRFFMYFFNHTQTLNPLSLLFAILFYVSTKNKSKLSARFCISELIFVKYSKL